MAQITSIFYSIFLLESSEQLQNFPTKLLFTSWNHNFRLYCILFRPYHAMEINMVNSRAIGNRMLIKSLKGIGRF